MMVIAMLELEDSFIYQGQERYLDGAGATAGAKATQTIAGERRSRSFVPLLNIRVTGRQRRTLGAEPAGAEQCGST